MTSNRGDIWSLEDGRNVLVLSSTFYNEIASEPTVIVVPVFTGEPDAGFGVPRSGDAWAAPGFITSLRKHGSPSSVEASTSKPSPTSTTCYSGSWPRPIGNRGPMATSRVAPASA
jgi:hypothetical protein